MALAQDCGTLLCGKRRPYIPSPPSGTIRFPAGSGGMVNSNILHMTKTASPTEKTIQLLHIFDVSLLAGKQGSRIEQTYITPIITSHQVEMLSLFPTNPVQAEILKRIQDSFRLTDTEFGYEIKLRSILSEIWLLLFEQFRSVPTQPGKCNINSDKIKRIANASLPRRPKYSRPLRRPFCFASKPYCFGMSCMVRLLP